MSQAAMSCPKCADELREIDSPEGVTLDFCSGCKGLFFDAGEVADYFELATDVPALDASHAERKQTELVCPKCQGKFEELRYSSLDSLVIDRCGGCGGIWLDRGEVPRLEGLAAKLERPASRLLRVAKQLKDKGFEPL